MAEQAGATFPAIRKSELMNRPVWQLNGAAFITGLFLVPVRFFLMFFPPFNLAEMILFAAAATIIASSFGVRPSWWVVLLFLPVFILVLFIIISWLGMSSLRQGVGIGHVVSLVLIPLSTLAGAHYGNKPPSASLNIRL